MSVLSIMELVSTNVIILLVLTTVLAMLDTNSLIDINVEVNCGTIVHDHIQ